MFIYLLMCVCRIAIKGYLLAYIWRLCRTGVL